MSSSSLSTQGNGMDGSVSSSRTVPRLPDDAIVDILSRLRAKALCRCKCVSKPWRDLIADRLSCKDLPQSLQGFLYFDVESRGDGDGSSDGAADADGGDLASGRDEMLLRHGHGRFISLLGKPMPLLDPSFAFLKEQPGVKAIELLDSCNGLHLFGHRRVSDTYDSLGYIVCNPVTEQWVTVPSSGWTPTPPEEIVYELENKVHTFLIFDPSVSSHFDLVQFWEDGMAGDVEGVHTYSSGTRLWCDRASEWRRWEQGGGWDKWGRDGAIRSKTRYGRAFVNGMLHFVFYQYGTDMYEIVAVDGKGKTCRVIRWPDQPGSPQEGFIGQSQGRLHCMGGLVGSGFRSGLSIWVLEDYDTEEWVLKHLVSFSHLFEGMDFGGLDLLPRQGSVVMVSSEQARMFQCTLAWFGCAFVGLHTDRNLIFFAQRLGQSLISYDMDSGEVCVLCTLGHGSPFVTPYIPSFKSL